ncbi:MAG: TRAP transporter small permease [Gammaproteobacteria bacterium]|nr:TRAP transporter small permease [Gammaproteobacteria bacterium]
MRLFIKSVATVSKACGVVAAVLVLLAILVVCQMVVIRYFLNDSTIWQTEFVIFSLVAATFIGSPYVLLIKGHVNVDLLPLYLGERGRRMLALIASTGGLLFCVLLTWNGFELFVEALEGGWTTDTVWALPLWIPYLPMPIGIGLLSLQYAADILALVTGHAMPFAMEAHNPYEGE